MFTPETELFNEFYSFCINNSFNTYDYLPPKEENAPYPFIVLGETQTVSDGTKSGLNGNLMFNIDFWNLATNRTDISAMMNDVFKHAINLDKTKHYRVAIDLQRTDQRLLTDYSVENQILLHGITNLTFNIL